MNLTIITPCSRPENLQKVKKSINVKCHWIIVYDSGILTKQFDEPWITELNIRGGVSGNLQRNKALDFIKSRKDMFFEDEYVYFLDDDNLLHPNFCQYLSYDNVPKGIIFAQELPNNQIRIPSPYQIKACCVDQAQYLLRLSLIGKKRFAQVYEADGHFIEEIYKEHHSQIMVSAEIMSYYNKLRQ